MPRKKKDKKEDEIKPIDEEELRQKQCEMINQMYPEGTFEELIEATTNTDTIPLTWAGKRFMIEYKWITWGAQNQIKEQVAKELGTNPSPIQYTRRTQELMLRAMIVKFVDRPMQDKHGEPMEINWVHIPAPVGEGMRQLFFNNTGEISAEILQKTESKSLDELIELLKNLKEKDGIVTDADKTLGN